jgi:heme-degrading monooxygenase HmoA
MTGRVRVVVYATAPAAEPDAVVRAYHEISAALRGTPGLLGNELLRSVLRPADYAVASEWADLPAFRDWEAGAAHRGTTAPLRPYQSAGSSPFGVYEVIATY